ncbi:hypothetical protein M9458_053383 [Cirrhinus mrigala]|uniref:Uncharacterized protein n=1 Tax=Cirrhinus mrigala TaxID=683832 RepID=A0ABD0MQ09_CIRMR
MCITVTSVPSVQNKQQILCPHRAGGSVKGGQCLEGKGPGKGRTPVAARSPLRSAARGAAASSSSFVHLGLQHFLEIKWPGILTVGPAARHFSGARSLNTPFLDPQGHQRVLHSGARIPWTLGAAAAENVSQVPAEDLTPSAASTRNRFTPLCETERDAVIVGNSIVQYVRATLAKGKVHTHCFPGARILDVSAQILAILKDGESVGAIILHAGVNDIKLRQTEVLKRDFSSLIETVCSTSPATRIIMSRPIPMAFVLNA